MGCLKFIGQLFLIFIGAMVVMVMIEGFNNDAEAEASESTTAERSAPPPESDNEFRVTTDPDGVYVSFEWDGHETGGRTPLTLTVDEGTEITYSTDIHESKGVGANRGTFEAPAADQTVSIWLNRLTEEELQAIEEQRQQEQAARERERAARERERAAQQRERTKDRLEDKRAEVVVACERLVRNQLRAPSTAKFGNIWNGRSNYYINPDGGTARYQATVDAQNGFGAMIRNTFTCIYELDTNTISLISLE